jgi:alkylhydroperoxidase/carboxymuconolactone decarboxylase family protein YurZ
MAKIYESPDGGETVFERDTKTGERTLIVKKEYPDWYIDDHDFSEIQHLANRGNKGLQNSLKELKLLYNLSRGNDD